MNDTISQRAREAVAQLLPHLLTEGILEGAKDSLSVVQAFARIEAEALARGRMEGAKAMQESVILKLDECCEPCFQCNQNVTAMDAAAIVKGRRC